MVPSVVVSFLSLFAHQLPALVQGELRRREAVLEQEVQALQVRARGVGDSAETLAPV